MRAVLERSESGDAGTFGRLTIGDAAFFSGELPWRDNAPNVSCVPAGLYRCAFTFSPKFRRMLYLILDVPGRTGIRFHAANYMGDTKAGYRSHLNGCIALGKRLGVMDGQRAILLSVPAMTEFERAAGGEPFELEVRQ